MFSLPLTHFEEYMLHDDRPSHPMAGIFRLRLSGQLDRGAFEAAWGQAAARHPLLRATVDRTRGRRPVWIDHPDWCPQICWQAETNERGFPSAGYIDLTQEPGTRVWVVDRDDGHDVVLQAHHCCADALGMNMVIDDLLVGYAMHQGGSGDGLSLPELEPQRLAGRAAPGLTAWKFLKMAHKQAVGVLGAREFTSHSPVPLAAPLGAVDEALPPSSFPNPCTHDFGPADTRRLLGAAKARGVTVNDLLARDLFQAVGMWREKHGLGDDRDWLRFSIPMNLRTPDDSRMPMTNSVSMVFLDRQPSSFSNPERLLAGIHEQMQRIKQLQLRYTFLWSLGLARLAPGGLARATSADKCLSTSCLSNIGPVFARTPLPRNEGRIVAGNVVLESADFVIPLRPHLHAAFCVYTYANRLCVLMHYDPRVADDGCFRDLLDTYVCRIQQSIDDVKPVP